MQGEAPSPSRRSVQRRQDRGKPLLYLGARFRMREYVEFILAYCGEDQQSYMRRVEPYCTSSAAWAAIAPAGVAGSRAA